MLRGLLIENQPCCFCTMRAFVSLARVALASDPLGEDRSKSVELQGREESGAPRTRTLDTIAGATVFKTASSASRTRSVCEMAPPLGIAPSSHRLTGGPHTLCVERNALRGSAPKTAERTRHSRWKAIAPGRNCTCVVPFRRRMPMICSATGADEMVARLGAAPSVSSSQARRIAVFLARDTIVSF